MDLITITEEITFREFYFWYSNTKIMTQNGLTVLKVYVCKKRVKHAFLVYYERKFLSTARYDIRLLVNKSSFSVSIIFSIDPIREYVFACQWVHPITLQCLQCVFFLY